MIIIYYKLKDYRPAVDISCSLLDYYIRKKDVYMQAYQESLLSVLYAKLQLYDSSKLLALGSLEKRKTFDNLHDIGESYNNLSLSQMGLKEWKEALVSLQLADSLMTKVGDERQLPIIRMNIAKAKIELGDFGAARQLLSQNIAATEQSGQKDILMANLNVLVTLCTKEGKYQEALAYTQQAQKLHDELFDFEKTKAINDLKNQIYQQQQKNTITQLRLEKTKRTYITLLVLVLALLVSTVLIFQYRKKRMQFLHQEAEIESHKQQLELLKDSIIKKNQLIESLEQTNIPSPKKQDENSEQLSELYQFKILTEDDWQAFKMLFDKVHPGLINRLRQNFPELTPAEERQFLLIQLKIDNKECANMLGISQPAVKKNRYRLKKRFNLGIEDNLDEFVYQFGQ
jgi:DNA-binding CsgD family transcriptional regulator/tetratricopeptide (TPR) repeat protein